MRTFFSLPIALLAIGGCRSDFSTDEDSPDLGFSSPPDLTQPHIKCPAARGLTGDNLLCVDFANTQTTIADLTAKGWDFTAAMSNCPGWQITNQLLQVINFGTLNGTCGLTLLPLTSTQIQKYGRLTLAIQHRIDLNDPEQQAQIYLNSVTPNTRLMWSATGKKDVPRQQTTVTIDNADLPASLKNGFKWLLQINSQLPVARNGWQIESIAINGNL